MKKHKHAGSGAGKRQLFSALLIGISLAFTGCAQEAPLSKAALASQAEEKAKEKQAMAEKKILSDFQNRAFKMNSLSQMPELKALMASAIGKLSQENAVKMLLNYELSQRIALQNDVYYGAVSPELKAALESLPDTGLLAWERLDLSDEAQLAELKEIKEGLFALYKDDSGIYRIVDYRELQKFKGHLSDECARYIDYMASESSQPSIRNKRFVVDREEAWRRLVYLDNYFTDYPVPSDDLIRNNLGRYYQDLMKHLIYGDDLSPNFDPITGVMNPEALAFTQSHQLSPGSQLYLPFENYKTQLSTDQGMLTPTLGTQIQQLLRIASETLTDHID